MLTRLSDWPLGTLKRRARRALERQLAYQEAKALAMPEDTRALELQLSEYARRVRARIERYRPIEPGARVLEVGSGAHGLVFFLGIDGAIGVDPLADEYARLFPRWQSRATTIAAYGEALPFESESFDVVLSDNVVDHAESPETIAYELARVLAPGGVLYFTVNVHHPVYGIASRLHAFAQGLNLPLEIRPFADHTVHLTENEARHLFDGLDLRIVHLELEKDDVGALARGAFARRAGTDLLKLAFFKNARFELVAIKESASRRSVT
jgi:SAM-dependent methyltransferase